MKLSDLEKIVQVLEEILPSDDSSLKKARVIEERSQFRAPEARDSSWIDMAMLLRSLPAITLAQLLFKQSSSINFTEEELVQARSALSKRRVELDQFIKSPKLNDQDREVTKEWIEHVNSAYEKVEEQMRVYRL